MIPHALSVLSEWSSFAVKHNTFSANKTSGTSGRGAQALYQEISPRFRLEIPWAEFKVSVGPRTCVSSEKEGNEGAEGGKEILVKSHMSQIPVRGGHGGSLNTATPQKN